jgi:uncharacterized protein (TIGR02145 family)
MCKADTPHSKQKTNYTTMKKLLFLTIILLLVFVSCTSKKQVILLGLTDTAFLKEARCNLRTPGWGESLGVVSFATDTSWLISNDSITQIWSDVVTATNCQKTNFKGDRSRSFNADCRSNPNHKGDLFSWCAVVRFQDTLCPYPWRVPTTQDFIDLDIVLGGTSQRLTTQILDSLETQLDMYYSVWRGEFSGLSNNDGTLWHQGYLAVYWSQNKCACGHGHALQFGLNSFKKEWFIGPRDEICKLVGASLRCVR